MSVHNSQLSHAYSLGGPQYYLTTTIGDTPNSLLGDNTVTVAYTLYLAEIFVNRNCTIGSYTMLNGIFLDSGATPKGVYILFDNGGHVVGRTVSGGTNMSGLNTFQNIARVEGSNPGNRITKGRYFFGFVCDGPGNYFKTIDSTRTLTRTGTVAAYETAFPAATRDLRYNEIPTAYVSGAGPVAFLTVV